MMYKTVASKRADVTETYGVEADSEAEAEAVVNHGDVEATNKKLLEMDCQITAVEEGVN